MKHPPARQLSQREGNNTTPTLIPSRISGLNPRPSTREHTIMSRKAEGFSGNEMCALNACLQVNLIVSEIEPLHRLLMFLRQFWTRICEELLKAKHVSESAKLCTELQRQRPTKSGSVMLLKAKQIPQEHLHCGLNFIAIRFCTKWTSTLVIIRGCAHASRTPKPGARGPISPNKGPKQLFLLVSVVDSPHRLL